MIKTNLSKGIKKNKLRYTKKIRTYPASCNVRTWKKIQIDCNSGMNDGHVSESRCKWKLRADNRFVICSKSGKIKIGKPTKVFFSMYTNLNNKDMYSCLVSQSILKI